MTASLKPMEIPMASIDAITQKCTNPFIGVSIVNWWRGSIIAVHIECEDLYSKSRGSDSSP
jgi:hypothetical protein